MKSNCCNADMRVGGEGETHFWVCESCKNACDPMRSLQELAQIEVNKALKSFNNSNYPYVATLATDVEISSLVTDDTVPETPPILE